MKMVFVTVAVVCMYATFFLFFLFFILEMCNYITYAPGHKEQRK